MAFVKITALGTPSCKMVVNTDHIVHITPMKVFKQDKEKTCFVTFSHGGDSIAISVADMERILEAV